MNDPIKLPISKEAAKLIVKYDFKKIRSDDKVVSYLSSFDQRILTARGIEVAKTPFGIRFNIIKDRDGIIVGVDSNYTLKLIPDSSWDPILADVDQTFQTYFLTGQDSYYTEAVHLLEKTILNWWPITSYRELKSSLSQKENYYSADFAFRIPTRARMDIALTISVKKDIQSGKFELAISFSAITADLLNATTYIGEKFQNLDLAVQEIQKYMSILTSV